MRFPEEEPDGSTPLDPEEESDLLPTHITTRAELNAWEQANITQGRTWGMRDRRVAEILTPDFLTTLHLRMFDGTWKWAGKYRQTGKNIGAPAHTITLLLNNLLDDAPYWLEHKSYGIDEIAVRLHHRLVAIHPFPNGNGRHSRLIVDILLRQLDVQPLTWGSSSLDHDGEVRSRYIQALRDADAGNYAVLLRFVRS